MTTDNAITIVHLAVDYNTTYRARTTPAVEWFIDELAEFEHVIIALRRSTQFPNTTQRCGRPGKHRVFDMPYFGLPFGIGLHKSLRRTARRIIGLLEEQAIRPDLIHAHKFSIEGLAGLYVARHFGVPLFVSLRGEVETKIFRFKPALRPVLREIAAYATQLYFVSAWFETEFRRQAPGLTAKERRLPNIVRNIHPGIFTHPANDQFLIALNLDTHKRKGLRWLLDAVALAVHDEPDLCLDIVGGGAQRSIDTVIAMIETRGLQNNVRLVGQIPNNELLARMAGYRGLALPSLNETFGMVYVEALFAGIPVIYTAGTAIDGYLDTLSVGIAVAPRDVGQICAALLDIWRRNEVYRANIANVGSELFTIFDPETHLAAYRADVHNALMRADV